MSTDQVRTPRVESGDGTRIAFRQTGTGPPVLFIHGGLGSAGSWTGVAQQLAEDHTVLLMDRRGHGDSDPGPARHCLAVEVNDAAAVLHAAAPEGVAVVGHSFGGAVALELALRHPGQVTRLAVYEPAVAVAGLIPGADLDQLEQIAASDPDQTLRLGLELLDRAGLVHGSTADQARTFPPALTQIAWTVARELRAVDQLDADLHRYAQLNAPTLVLIGEASPARQHAICRRLAHAMPAAQAIWLAGQGHVAHTAAPGLFVDRLRPFLA